ncbi:MAG: ribosome maturation factor [Saprospiraceae bacterium]|nr:ribosome maturation factor [Saprospiraceae bacterium]
METNEISTWVEQFMENIDGDYYLVDVLWNRKSLKLEVFIDTDEGVTLGECQQISRLIQSDLDLSGLAPENYMLDVSSPGLERPLKLRRQYVKNVGKVLLVELKGGAKEIGRLERVEEDGLVISPEKKGVKGRKTTYGIEKMILWSEIEKTFVQIRF